MHLLRNRKGVSKMPEMETLSDGNAISATSDATPDNLAIDTSEELQDASAAESSHMYDQIDLELLFDISEGHIAWPFNEVNAEIEYRLNAGVNEDALLNNDDACLLFAVEQSMPMETASDICNVFMDGVDSFDSHLFFPSFPNTPEMVPTKPLLFPSQSRERLPITLVLDLDETLVHSSLEYCEVADFTFQVQFGNELQTVYVRQRPFLHMFLEAVAKMFEIIVFTASQSVYATQLLDILDPDHRLICARAYRDSCVLSESGYTKDLTILGRDLAKVAIVDNSPQVYQLQVENGIPIQSWFGDPADSALVSLLPFLETLAGADDVRPIIAKKFNSQDCQA